MRPANDSSRQKIRNQRNDYCAERRALYVWGWVECNLPGKFCCIVPEMRSGPSVSCFVQGNGKQKYEIPVDAISEIKNHGYGTFSN